MPELYGYQHTGVAFLTNHPRAYLTDEMGLGKTAQALRSLESLNAYPALIVCRAAAKLNWRRECRLWVPGRSVQIISSSDPIGGADITVLNYDILMRHFPGIAIRRAHWQAVVFDEAQALKNRAAKRTRGAARMAAFFPRVWMLTGTPVLNRPAELVAPLEILGLLGSVFGGYWPFLRRYCNPTQHRFFGWDPRQRRGVTRFYWDTTGCTNIEELHDLLVARVMLGRTKAEVMPELPERRNVELPLECADLTEYREAERNLLQWLAQTRGTAAAKRAGRAERMVRVNYLKQLAAQAKLPHLFAWIDDFLESDQKLVVFAYHQAIQRALCARYPNAARLVGMESSAAARQANIDLFQENPACRLFIGSLEAAGTSINLTAASNVLFAELGWTPAAHQQATDRLHRIGQRNAVTAYYALAEGTIDYRIMRLLIRKYGTISTITQGDVFDELIEAII